jgi:hypothetical protein
MMQTATVKFPIIANFEDYHEAKDHARFLSFAIGQKVSFKDCCNTWEDDDVPSDDDFNVSCRARYFFEFDLE